MGDEFIALEDTALNEMRGADLNVISLASTCVDGNTGKQFHETSKDQNSFQRSENRGTDPLCQGFLSANWGLRYRVGLIRTNGMVTGVKPAGDSGIVWGRRPVDGLSAVFFFESNGFVRRVRTLKSRRLRTYVLQIGCLELLPILFEVRDESGIFGFETQGGYPFREWQRSSDVNGGLDTAPSCGNHPRSKGEPKGSGFKREKKGRRSSTHRDDSLNRL